MTLFSLIVNKLGKRFETTLNYRMVVKRYPNLKEEIDGSISGSEISSLLDIILAMWSTTSCVWRWHVNLLSKTKQKTKIG